MSIKRLYSKREHEKLKNSGEQTRGEFQLQAVIAGSTGTQLGWAAWQALAADETKLLDRINLVLLNGTTTAAQRQALSSAMAAVKNTDPAVQARKRVQVALYVACILPHVSSRSVGVPMTISRRELLHLVAGGSAVAAMDQLGLSSAMADTSSYRAMVGVFLFGGNDAWSMVVPTDGRFTTCASQRGSVALQQSSLIPLTGTPFGLHPSLAALKPAWTDGALASC